MNSHIVPQARAILLFATALASATSITAEDLAVTGNLSVTGDADISGNTLSFGTRADSSTTPGLNLLYGDATAPTIYFNATRNGASWLWQSNTSTPQLKLTGTNQLLLYDQATTPAVKITLDPAGTSTFAKSVVLNGTDNQMPNQTITGPGSVLTKATGLTQAAGNQTYLRLDAGNVSLAGGVANSPYYATAMSGGSATGWYSTAMSSGSAEGYGATAMSGGWASGDGSTAMSGGMALGTGSTAIGADTTASGLYQVVIGHNNISQGAGGDPLPTDDLFIIGNGLYNVNERIDTPSNAFVVRENGNVRVAGDVQSKGGFRTPPMGDLSMGDFHTGANPADPQTGLNAGLRYPTE